MGGLSLSHSRKGVELRGSTICFKIESRYLRARTNANTNDAPLLNMQKGRNSRFWGEAQNT